MEEQAVNNPIQQPNIPTPPEPKHHSFLTNKLFLITLAIAVLFTAVYAGIYLYLGSQLDKISKPSPTPLPAETSVKEGDPTANWKTYTEPIFGASFRYPPNWSLDPGEYNVERTYWSLSIADPSYADQNCQGDCPYFDITFIAESNQNNLSLIDVISRDFKDLTGGHQEYSDLKIDDWITPSGVKFKKATGIAGSGAFYYLYTLHNNKIYTIFPGGGVNAVLDDENDLKTKKDLAVTDQILSTFKFTDEEDQIVCTQEAKLCPDGSYVSRQPPTCEFAPCPQK